MCDQAVHLLHADSSGGMADLTVKIGRLHDIAVDDADSADAGAGDVLSGGAAEAAGSDDEYSGVDQTELSWER
jgi:hypothetical protein